MATPTSLNRVGGGATRQAALRAGHSEICGLCAGHREVWCPECFGFDGCYPCRHTRRVRCPECAGGQLYPLRW